MNISLPFTNIRSFALNEFSSLRRRALRETLWSKLMGKDTKLARFPEGAFQTGLNRKSLGLQDILVTEIVGTLYRHSDFDCKFRPLKKNLCDRWVDIYLLYEKEDRPPILVHKVGDHYYVEDGHHRVSVARALGITFIQARVWEYPSCVRPAGNCESVDCRERRSIKKYATATD